jgi:hypothetical protein
MLSLSFDDYVKLREDSIFKIKHDIVSETFGRAIVALLDDYLQYLHLIRELAIEFDTEKKLESHKNLWDAYAGIKSA